MADRDLIKSNNLQTINENGKQEDKRPANTQAVIHTDKQSHMQQYAQTDMQQDNVIIYTKSCTRTTTSVSTPSVQIPSPDLSPLGNVQLTDNAFSTEYNTQISSESQSEGYLDVALDTHIDDVFANGSPDLSPGIDSTVPEGCGISRSHLHPEGTSQSFGSTLPRKSSLIKDSSRRGANRRKKTVSFSSMPGERTVVNAADCLEYMQTGSEMIKIRSNGKQYHRLFTLDLDMREIKWVPTTKKKEKAKLSVDQIKEVRIGRHSDTPRIKDVDWIYQDPCFFSIVFGDNFETLDLVASSADEANIWVTGLTCLTTGKHRTNTAAGLSANGSSVTGAAQSGDSVNATALIERQQLRDKWLQEVFESADVDGLGELNQLEVIQLMKKLNNSIATIKIQQKLKEMSLTKEGEPRERLTSTEFANLFKEISTRPEIYFLLVRYASATDYMTTDELMFFLEAEQGMCQVSGEKCLDIIQEFEPSSQCRELAQLGIDGFTQYLLSEECDIFDPYNVDVCQDMTHPLSHYFIASSHNTYLLKDQLKGPSSVEGYVRALKKGCRYIELDCWDGSNDEPIIYHGHTLTSKIPFSAVIDVINEYAFCASEYPVIVNIENHCGVRQQQAMAECMKRMFGDKLYADQADPDRVYLPSPEFFKRKILVLCKKLTECDETGDGYVTEDDENADTEPHRNKTNKKEGSVKKYRLSKELSDVVQYCRSARFRDFQTAQQCGKCTEVYSFSESTAMRLANACPEEFVNHNKRVLSRIYPNSMRVDSSNYNPQDLWNCGCQLVALNYQTCGLMMDLNDGRFMQNGGCGFVLKPAVMREEIAYFSANTRDIIPGVSPQILHVKIISGQQLPKPKASGAKGTTVDPYVTVEVFGIPADCVEERTKTVQHSQNPIFDECFEFKINLPELALVRFAVLDDEYIGDEFIGQYTIPFVCMQPGYRHIRLRANTGEILPNCTLFVHIAITNRKGGGKASRRSGSLLRSRKPRTDSNYQSRVSLKTLGVKIVDETFKAAAQSLRDGVELCDKVHVALTTLKELCSLSPISNVKQVIRAILARIQNTSEHVVIHVTLKDIYPVIEVQGSIADALKKSLTAFHTLMDECQNLVTRADEICDKLLNVRASAMEHHEELQQLATQQGLKGKKLNKAMENFSWNVRVLKGQVDLLRQAKAKCLEDIKQIQDTASFMGLMKGPGGGASTPMPQRSVVRVSSTSSINSNSSRTSDVTTAAAAAVTAAEGAAVGVYDRQISSTDSMGGADNSSDHS